MNEDPLSLYKAILVLIIVILLIGILLLFGMKAVLGVETRYDENGVYNTIYL